MVFVSVSTQKQGKERKNAFPIQIYFAIFVNLLGLYPFTGFLFSFVKLWKDVKLLQVLATILLFSWRPWVISCNIFLGDFGLFHSAFSWTVVLCMVTSQCYGVVPIVFSAPRFFDSLWAIVVRVRGLTELGASVIAMTFYATVHYDSCL